MKTLYLKAHSTSAYVGQRRCKTAPWRLYTTQSAPQSREGQSSHSLQPWKSNTFLTYSSLGEIFPFMCSFLPWNHRKVPSWNSNRRKRNAHFPFFVTTKDSLEITVHLKIFSKVLRYLWV